MSVGSFSFGNNAHLATAGGYEGRSPFINSAESPFNKSGSVVNAAPRNERMLGTLLANKAAQSAPALNLA